MIKKNNLIVMLIVFIILFFGMVTYYKFNKIDENRLSVKKHHFVAFEIKNFRKDNETEVNDVEMYGDYIIQRPMYKVDFEFYDNKSNQVLEGYVSIDDDKKLYITDIKKNLKHKVSDEKFKTMYVKEYEYTDSICINLISEDKKAYLLVLDSNDVTKVTFYDYGYPKIFTNFVDIEFYRDKYFLSNAVFVLTDEGKIYDINTGIRYDERTKAVYNSIYIYHDNTMTDIYGRLIEDADGKRYKIKYIFDVSKENKFLENKGSYIIVTEDNKFITFSPDMAFVYEFDQKVKDIKYDQYDAPHLDGNLEIIFEDDYKVDFTASCTRWYCVNELGAEEF